MTWAGMLLSRAGIVFAKSALFSLFLSIVCSSCMGGYASKAGNNSRTSAYMGKDSDVSGENRNDDLALKQLKERAKIVYVSGMKAVLKESRFNVGDIWALLEILKSAPNRKLRQFVDSKMSSFAGDPFELLINPDAPRVALPVDPGVGLNRLYHYMLALAGFPEKRAISFISDFLSTNESGYILTHQLLVLEWSKQTGLALPDNILLKKNILLERIKQEQLGDESFSDLYAERVAILLHFGKQEVADVAKWVKTIVEAHLRDGSWGQYSDSLSYDGGITAGGLGANHTRVLALLAIRDFLDNY